jgi:hypothetical protein
MPGARVRSRGLFYPSPWTNGKRMELPAELFAELTEGAHYEMEPPSARLREARRLRVTMEATIVRLNDGRNSLAMPAVVRDLSSRGIGIECAMAVHVKDQFAIRLMRKSSSPVWIHCEVARWQPIGEKLYVIGAKFTGIFVPPKSAEGSAPVAA